MLKEKAAKAGVLTLGKERAEALAALIGRGADARVLSVETKPSDRIESVGIEPRAQKY